MFKKYSETAQAKTHGLVDASAVDLVNPSVALDTAGEFARMAVSGLVGWVGHNYKQNGTFGL